MRSLVTDYLVVAASSLRYATVVQDLLSIAIYLALASAIVS